MKTETGIILKKIKENINKKYREKGTNTQNGINKRRKKDEIEVESKNKKQINVAVC